MDKGVKEGQRFKHKDEALAAFESTLRSEPDEKDDKAYKSWEQLSSGVEHEAEELGASNYELTRVRFLVLPEIERQALFEVYKDTDREGRKSLEEQREYLDVLIKIRDDFDLKDSI